MQDGQFTCNSNQGVNYTIGRSHVDVELVPVMEIVLIMSNFNQTHNEKPHSSNFQLLVFCHNCETNNH